MVSKNGSGLMRTLRSSSLSLFLKFKSEMNFSICVASIISEPRILLARLELSALVGSGDGVFSFFSGVTFMLASFSSIGSKGNKFIYCQLDHEFSAN